MVNSTDGDYHVDADGLPDMDRYNFTENERNYLFSLENQLQYISEFERLFSLKCGETTYITEEFMWGHLSEKFMWENLFTVRKMLTDNLIFSEGEREYLMLETHCKHFVNEYNRLVKMKLVQAITTNSNDLQFVDVIDCQTELFTHLPVLVEGADYSWLDNYDDEAPMEIFCNQEHQQQEEEARENRRLLRLAVAVSKTQQEQGLSGVDKWSTPPQRSFPPSGAPVKRHHTDEEAEEGTPVCKKKLIGRKLYEECLPEGDIFSHLATGTWEIVEFYGSLKS